MLEYLSLLILFLIFYRLFSLKIPNEKANNLCSWFHFAPFGVALNSVLIQDKIPPPPSIGFSVLRLLNSMSIFEDFDLNWDLGIGRKALWERGKMGFSDMQMGLINFCFSWVFWGVLEMGLQPHLLWLFSVV